jgi:hypothetical protein
MKRTTLIAAGIGTAAVFGLAGTTLAGAAVADQRAPSAAPSGVPTTLSSDPAVAPSTATGSDPAVAPSTSTGSGAATVSGAISEAQAREIAIRTAGGGQVTEIEAETEQNRPIWEVDVLVGDVEHDMDVDRDSGEVRDHEKETADQDDARDDQDDDQDDRDDDDDDDRD